MTPIAWDKYHHTLGMTPNQWIAKHYPSAVDTRELAQTLASLLETGESLYSRIVKKASVLGVQKTPESQSARYAQMRELPARPQVVSFTDCPTIDANPVCITGDWHIPYYHYDLTQRLLDICSHWDPPVRTLVVSGDFIDFDRISMFTSETETRSTEDDLRDAEDLLTVLSTWFDDILLIRGNHENRLYDRKLEKEIGYERLMRVINIIPDKVRFSKYTHCLVNGTWRISHPKSYSRVPGAVARRLAEKYRQNVICAHGHGMSVSAEVSGGNMAVDGGGMMDPERVAYYMLNETTHPIWIPGFIILNNNKPHLFNYVWCDWEYWYETLHIEEGF